MRREERETGNSTLTYMLGRSLKPGFSASSLNVKVWLVASTTGSTLLTRALNVSPVSGRVTRAIVPGWNSCASLPETCARIQIRSRSAMV